MIGLNEKQQKFVVQYVATGSAIGSYRGAGYKDGSSITVNANQLLNNPKIKAAIESMRSLVEAASVQKVVDVREEIDQGLKRIATKAEAAEKYQPAINALVARARLHGLMVEKVEGNIHNTHIDWVKKLSEARESKPAGNGD